MTVPPTAKSERALTAATDVFTRHGYARTTMGDIAKAAGMSRPALYLIFADKQAAFTAVIADLDARAMADIRAMIAQLPDTGAKLRHACVTWGCHGVDLAAAHPDAADLFDLRFPAVQRVYADFQVFVAELLAEDVRRAGLAATPEEVARALVFGMRGLRATARDREDMAHLIEIQITTVVRSLSR